MQENMKDETKNPTKPWHNQQASSSKFEPVGC